MLVDRERRADKKSRSVRSGVRNRKYQSVIPTMAVPWTTRVPRAWAEWESHSGVKY